MSLKAKVEKMPFYNQLVLPWHWAQALVATNKYGHPAKHLRVIGVTGTNGKTTTSFMIWKMLNAAGHKTGLLTTVAWGGVGGDEAFVQTPSQTASSREPSLASSPDKNPRELDATFLHKQYEHMTTERVEVLNERMRAIAEAGAEFMVLEVTSHALAQYRTLGVPIEIAVFTNLTHEHLDYHGTFANYRAAKLKLFRQAKFGVVNADDPNAQYFTEIYAPSDITTYGINRSTYQATDIKLNASGVKYSCGDIKIETQIPGKFNVYNSLAALSVGKRLGLSNQQIQDGIKSLASVEGRMNRIVAGQNFEVIVDYAHTPDALEKVFESLDREAEESISADTTSGGASDKSPAHKSTGNHDSVSGKSHAKRIISVHGGAGRRDESTRSIRGEILGKYSDIVIITEDDSRDEDPAQIAQQFVDGAKKAGKVLDEDLFVELDRGKAIALALALAKKDDLVLVLGKGHEKTILRADGPYPFEDIKVVENLLRK